MRLWLVVASLWVGCGPSVLFRARSPDLSHRIEVHAEDGGERAHVDGTAGALFLAIGAGAIAFTDAGAAFYAASDASGWRVVGPSSAGPTFMEIAVPLFVLGEQPLYVAASAEGWHVVHGDVIGPASSGPPTDLRVLGDRYGYVAHDEAGARWMWGGEAGPGFQRIELVRVGDGGSRVVYAGTRETGTHVVSSTPSGTTLSEAHESVLELVAAANAPGYAALLGIEEHTELVHAPSARGAEGGATEVHLASAPLLTHLRITDDGLHTACLSAAEDGRAIEVLLDGVSIARHRRVDGERLTFVPGSDRLFWVAEDAQGLVVHEREGDREAHGERFESIDGPFVARGSVGYIGRRGGRAEVFVDGARVADEAYAAQLRIGPGGHYAFMVRSRGARFVVTRRGRWPIPRFFIDTLTLDESGEHWAALVPDGAERVLSVWIDGEPRVEVPAEEVLEPALARGIDPPVALRAMVEAVLAAHLRWSEP